MGMRFESRPGDAAEAAAGLIPVLITAGGEPCPGALFEAEPVPMSSASVRHGISEHGLDHNSSSLLRADSRGTRWQ